MAIKKETIMRNVNYLSHLVEPTESNKENNFE